MVGKKQRTSQIKLTFDLGAIRGLNKHVSWNKLKILSVFYPYSFRGGRPVNYQSNLSNPSHKWISKSVVGDVASRNCRSGTHFAVWRFVVWWAVISPSQGPIQSSGPIWYGWGSPGGGLLSPNPEAFVTWFFYDKYEHAAAIEWQDTIWLAIMVFGVIFYKFLSRWGQCYNTIQTKRSRANLY